MKMERPDVENVQRPRNVNFSNLSKDFNLRDEKVRAQYAMYVSGKSLSKIAKVYDVTSQSILYNFKKRGYEMRKKKVYETKIINGIKFSKSADGGRNWRATSPKYNQIHLEQYLRSLPTL